MRGVHEGEGAVRGCVDEAGAVEAVGEFDELVHGRYRGRGDDDADRGVVDGLGGRDRPDRRGDLGGRDAVECDREALRESLGSPPADVGVRQEELRVQILVRHGRIVVQHHPREAAEHEESRRLGSHPAEPVYHRGVPVSRV